ncbi:hypothetical protein CTEN210_00794 [Chaetoceros tenuissimus]|uniref:Peptidase A1 domain-containing protein n=1 Tax=Chaetoceros tenuissimus TaxID=426638 RepID=A0AAD3CFU8_9STRA|nr:hypothetical protein CTEN210_00794 [Chaetoceros tenuissimus]
MQAARHFVFCLSLVVLVGASTAFAPLSVQTVLKKKDAVLLHSISSSSVHHANGHHMYNTQPITNIQPYNGPKGDMTQMEYGMTITLSGASSFNILVGPSSVAQGKGLFLAPHESSLSVTIPIGTPLCRYPSGQFTSQPQGDKCVLFAFTQNQPEATPVFFQEKLMSLADAIKNISFSSGSLRKSTRLLYGHEVHLYRHKMDIIPSDGDNIFVPHEDVKKMYQEMTLAAFANDLAFDWDISEELYNDRVDNLNVLQFVWELKQDTWTGGLVPVAPILCANRDIRLEGMLPMEVGLAYGFQFWQDAAQKKLIQEDSTVNDDNNSSSSTLKNSSTELVSSTLGL